MTMKQVRIAELKARLSEYLRAVRRGEWITVIDRETPVAKIVPVPRDGPELRVGKPAPGHPAAKPRATAQAVKTEHRRRAAAP